MAGGSGTRFWPASRRARPKQLLPLAGTRSLLRATIDRIAPLVPSERVVVVTSAALLEATREVLPELASENVLAEPVGRNTAPCIGWAAATIRKRDPEAVLAVLAADQHVTDEPGFVAVCRRALEAAGRGALVTIGITPTYAETGYGWIEVGGEVGPGVNEVVRFVEKPDAVRARAYLEGGVHLWNAGQFFFRADAILAAIEMHLPALAAGLLSIESAPPAEASAVLAATYPTLPSISIDHGVMEKARGVLCVPGSFGWSDVGSWTAAWDLGARDGDGNVVDGAQGVLVDTRGSYVRAPAGKVVALIGVEDLVVVDTPDALLVMPRARAQDVRAVVGELEKRAPDKL